jgi:hypothetical protein
LRDSGGGARKTGCRDAKRPPHGRPFVYPGLL